MLRRILVAPRSSSIQLLRTSGKYPCAEVYHSAATRSASTTASNYIDYSPPSPDYDPALPPEPASTALTRGSLNPGNHHPARHVDSRTPYNVSSSCSRARLISSSALLSSCHDRRRGLRYPPGTLWLELLMSNLTQRRGFANKHDHADHDHDHHSGDEHSHSHSHGLFHSHSHGHGHGAEGASEIIKALSGEAHTVMTQGDRGSRITLIGLASNVVLSAAKGVAGVYLNSAALVADAAHSLSDLLGDFVTLACWKISRHPPTDAYPYGYGKFETLGTAIVSLFLVGGAAAIGLHSYTMLLDALSPTLATMQPGPAHDILQVLVGTKESLGEVLHHTHGHAHVEESGVLDPNAAWFALASVIVKEWMYRATKASDDMKSPVLLANAYHHRSDAYSSLVTLLAILGTWTWPAVPLDPLGGMLVSLLILQQGASLTWGAFGDFTDAGVPLSTRLELTSLISPLVAPGGLLGVRNVRAVRSGSVMFVDLTADVPADMTVGGAHEVE
ncbi:hypothetical protein FRC09_001096, partial [Ceratobasidium sp. 395]